MFSLTPEKHVPLQDLVSLRGKRALVTGAASGIGRAIAERYAEAGAELDLVDVNEEGLQEVQAELASHSAGVHVHRVDLASKAEIDALWNGLAVPGPDVLVNCAGVYPMKDFLEMDETFLRKLEDVILHSAVWMCQRFVRTRGNRGGVIINVGSIEALLPFKTDLAHYTMTKAGVLALTRALAKDYGKHFRVNALVPGGILTPGVKEVAKDIFHLHFDVVKAGVEFRARLPIGRFGRADEVARMALVLASDLASYVQGALIAVDGGFLSA